jgi:hypothetical protein
MEKYDENADSGLIAPEDEASRIFTELDRATADGKPTDLQVLDAMAEFVAQSIHHDIDPVWIARVCENMLATIK